MKNKARFFMFLIINQIFIITGLGLFLIKFHDNMKKIKMLQLVFSIFICVIIVFSIIDILSVMLRKFNLDKLLIKLEIYGNFNNFIRMMPNILIIFGLLNISVSKNIYLLLLSINSIFFGLTLIVRGIFYPVGLTESRLVFYGATYLLTDIVKCTIKKDNNCIEFMTKKRNFLFTYHNNLEEIISLLNKNNINIKYI